jgi:O-antigen/teichoic acid export membrane protein
MSSESDRAVAASLGSIPSVDAEPIRLAAATPRSEHARWISKGVLAVADQGLISGSNFALSVLLARWTSLEQYGAYAVAFGTFVLLSQLYQATVLEPMSVFGGSIYKQEVRHYLGLLCWLHLFLSIIMVAAFGVAVAIAAYLGATPVLVNCLAALTLSSPCVLLLWLARRAQYMELSPTPAALGALLYSGIVLGVAAIIHKWYALSAWLAFAVMGIAALMTAIFLLCWRRPVFSLGANSLSLREVARKHWEYGRWAIGSSLAIWIPSNVYYFIVPAFAGVAQAGTLRAMMNFTLPAGQTTTALQLLFQTHTAQVQHERGNAALKSLSLKLARVFLLGSLLYWGALIAFGKPLVHLLYAGKYTDIADYLPWLALAFIVNTMNSVPTVGLRALQRPSAVFAAYSVATAVTLLMGIPLTWAWGVKGVIAAMLAAHCATMLVSVRVFRRQLETSAVPQEAAI